MIHALDHVALAVSSPDAAVLAYAALLGRGATGEGAGAHFQLANVRLEFSPAPPSGSDPLAALGFAAQDLAKARNLLERRGLPSRMDDAGAAGPAPSLHIAPEATFQVPIRLGERDANAPAPPPSPLAADESAAATGLDHVVLRSPNPERAIALYAGRLGLSLRLDRSEPAWGMRLVFFRCGDLIVEVAHGLKAGIGDGPDRLWGLSWRVADITRAHARLQGAGVEVSAIRTGRRPNTRVFTVKSHTAGVPTLMFGPA